MVKLINSFNHTLAPQQLNNSTIKQYIYITAYQKADQNSYSFDYFSCY
jgi:hypothetical protein